MDIFKTLLVSTPGAVGSSVAITGGSINGTNIGATTPGSGAFTTLTASGATTLTATTASTSTTTGALVVSGGVGVAGAVWAGGKAFFNGASDIGGNTALQVATTGGGIRVDSGSASSGTYPALILTSSGAGWGSGFQLQNSTAVTGRKWGVYAGSGGNLSFADETAGLEWATTTGGSIGAGNFKVNYTTASTSTTTGALVVSGGIGAAGAANVGTYYGMVDGVTAPGATVGYAKIYVDTADGDLKVIFGDGTIKTLATDT
jgi:hypothetical protein